MSAISLLVQSALLVLVAYFGGAWLGCVLRRLGARKAATQAAAVATGTAGAAQLGETAGRFNQALSAQPQTPAAAPPVVEPESAQPTREPEPVAPEPAIPEPAVVSAYEPVAPQLETIAAPPQQPATPEPGVEIVATAVNSSAETGVVAAEVYIEPNAPSAGNDVAASARSQDDLSLVRGIDEKAQQVLAAAGLTSFAQLGALTAGEVRNLDTQLDDRGRIARQNWIEQAQMLAADRTTVHARQSAGRAGIVLAAPTADEGPALKLQSASAPAAPEASPAPSPDTSDTTNAAGLAAATAASAAAGLASTAAQVGATALDAPAATPTGETTSVGSDDNLLRIDGITPEISEMLKSRGIRRYSQIAAWGDADIQRIEALLGVSGRVSGENWIGQARDMVGEPEGVSADDAPQDLLSGVARAGAANLTGLRSVKSPAFTDRPAVPLPPSGQLADLKRIRGVGVLIEKKLHMLGVHSYDQIANWTRSDIDRVSRELDFKGRIERENWVEQARILVSGGQTNFSRRFDTKAHVGGSGGSSSAG